MEKKELKIERINLLNERIESERLLLIPISMTHKKEIFKEFTDEITIYMGPAPAKEISETESFIASSLKELDENKTLQLVILAKKSQEFLGCAGLHHLDRNTPEMGVWLKKKAHGNGYGKEAMAALKEWADKNLNYEYLLYPVAEENYPSRKIPEFLGGKIAREYDDVNMSGKKLHLIEYRIFRK